MYRKKEKERFFAVTGQKTSFDNPHYLEYWLECIMTQIDYEAEIYARLEYLTTLSQSKGSSASSTKVNWHTE
jgi:hypothetical protein